MKRQMSYQVYPDFRPPITLITPIARRKYTMTHSDTTGNLFVSIGLDYAEDVLNPTHDEVLLEWVPLDNGYVLFGQVLVTGEGIFQNADIRFNIFNQEMPIALGAIYAADKTFFKQHPELSATPVTIHFKSTDSDYDRLISFGPIGNFSSPHFKS